MTQTIRTVLEVNAGRAVSGFAAAEQAAKRYAGGLDDAGKSFQSNRESWDKVGDTALIAGTAIAGGLALATKAAIDWESAWAGVAKTVDGTPEQMAALEEELRGLATTLPATHEEIAGVAEAAGQLGIARDDIAAFTETAIALGESTNLSAEEAATGLAKISNIMGTQAEYGIEGIERMGSALVALGNDGASTESDILAMGQRIAGAGETVGATEADVLALANALSSVGVEAQLGGGAMSRALLEMNSAVLSGGEELENFARISGMTADEFATAWRADPVAAVGEFVGGLGRVSAQGGDAAAALESVGLRGTENAQVFLRAAGASDLLTESLELGEQAWEANTALQEEAAKRYETTASQLQVAQNTIRDAAIDLGSTFGPMLATLASGVADAADAFSDLPGPVQDTVAALAGITALGLLGGGAAIKVVGFATDLNDAFGKISKSGPRAEKAMRGAARGAKVLGAAAGAATAVGVLARLLEDSGSAIGVEKLTSGMLDAADAVDVLDAVIDEHAATVSGMDGDVRSFGDALKVAFDPSWINSTNENMDGLLSAITFGMADLTTAADESEKVFGLLDDQLAGLVTSGNADEAGRLFAQYAAAAEAAGVSTEELLSKLPGYTEATAAAGNQAKLAGGDIDGMTGELQSQEQAAADAEAALDDLQSQIEMLGGGFRGERAAVRSYEESLQAVKDAAKEGGPEFEAALDGMAQSALDVASAQIEMGRSASVVEADLAAAREAFIEAGVAAGNSRPYMEGLADSMGLIPSEVSTMISQTGAGQAQADVLALDEQIKTLDGKTVSVKEAGAIDAKGRVLELDGSIFGLDGKTVKVEEIGSTASGDRVVRLDGKIYRLKGKTVDVVANVSGTSYVDNLRWAIGALRSKSITVTTYHQTLYRNNAPGRSPGPWNYNNADGGIHGPGLVREFADGGVGSFSGQMPHIRAAGGAGVTWAEEGAGPWEAWISGHPAKTARSKAIADDVVSRLGGTTVWPRMADGGTWERMARSYAAPSFAPVVVQAPQAAPGDVIARLHPADIKAIVAGVQQGAYAGASLQRRNEYAKAATTPRGRDRS